MPGEPRRVIPRRSPGFSEAASRIGGKIREERQRNSWSQETLAVVSGIGIETLRRFERGIRIPDGETLMKLAAALACRVEDLLPENYLTLFAPRLWERLGQRLASVPVPLAAPNEGATSSRRSPRRSASISRDSRAELKHRISRARLGLRLLPASA